MYKYNNLLFFTNALILTGKERKGEAREKGSCGKGEAREAQAEGGGEKEETRNS